MQKQYPSSIANLAQAFWTILNHLSENISTPYL